MSKGNELWAKRDDLLKDLYERGAIAPERAVKASEVREAIGVDEMTIVNWEQYQTVPMCNYTKVLVGLGVVDL